MARYTITPWRSQSDLLLVRNQLYNPQEPSDTNRKTAINQILAWKMRGNLPHAIESTALLTDAILHYKVPGNSNFSVRAVYSAAFTRFVTGFCDIGRNRERSLEPSSMLDIANKIGMPAHFVALRHEATHEEMPSLQRLVRVTEEALQWLWSLYWSRLEEPESEEVFAAALPEFRTQAKEVLKTYRTARLEALRSKKRGKNEDDVKKTAEACAGLVAKSQVKLDALVKVLVEERLLCPSKRELGSSLDGAFMIWDDLLQRISSVTKQFLRALINGLLRGISSSSPTETAQDAEKEAMCSWVIHIAGTKSWAAVIAEKPALRREIMEWCCVYPGVWTHFLGTKVLQGGDSSFQEDWADLFAASQLVDGNGGSDDMASVVGGALESSHENSGAMDVDLGLGSWVRAAAPIRAPFGVVR